MWVNLHTHKELSKGVVGIQNIDNPSDSIIDGNFYSIGLHPLQIIDSSWSEKFNQISKIAVNNNIMAIGECGFDKFKGNKNLQTYAFSKHIELSETISLPLIIHNVGGDNKIWEFHKKERPLQPWIIHGFMGNSNTAEIFAKLNLYCSFNLRSLKNAKTIEAFKLYPPHLTFLETDDSTTSIEEVYYLAESLLEKNHETIKDQYYSNFRTLFKLND